MVAVNPIDHDHFATWAQAIDHADARALPELGRRMRVRKIRNAPARPWCISRLVVNPQRDVPGCPFTWCDPMGWHCQACNVDQRTTDEAP